MIIQKTATGDLTGNKIADKITRTASRSAPGNDPSKTKDEEVDAAKIIEKSQNTYHQKKKINWIYFNINKKLEWNIKK